MVVMSLNHRSTQFNHEELVGVKCRWKRLCLSSHLATFSCLWVAWLSKTMWMSLPLGTSRPINFKKLRNSWWRWRENRWPISSPVSTLRAANKVVVPLRL